MKLREYALRFQIPNPNGSMHTAGFVIGAGGCESIEVVDGTVRVRVRSPGGVRTLFVHDAGHGWTELVPDDAPKLSDEEIFTCVECGKACGSAAGLGAHMRVHRPAEPNK